MSIKEDVTLQLFDLNFTQWLLGLIERSTKNADIHVFCVDFATALLANIFNNTAVIEKLEKNQRLVQDFMLRQLNLLKENVQTTVLIHLLISLSYLSKDCFRVVLDECQFLDKISDFVEWYTLKHTSPMDLVVNTDKPSLTHTGGGARTISERKTVLDLCAHMFHQKDAS